MATLVLSTVGTVIGGPIGGALGSLIGQTIDQQLFGPPARRGPRLGDLSVQTSSYGTPIPRIFGTMRVAGTVVWATDLKEEENVEGGGKGGPEVVTYAYSVSLAVALSSRRGLRVGRIWADGKLLRGAAGDFKVKCKFRFYPGSENQPVDPLIAGIEGAGQATAFRGLALAVFEDLALVDYGNRIPMLTFELVADEGEVEIGAILGDVSRGLVAASSGGPAVTGFAAHGPDQRSAIDDLVSLWGIELVDAGGRLRIVRDAGVALASDRERGCGAGGGDRGEEERSQQQARALPASLTLNYYDRSRDYQAGQMRAVVSGGGRTEWRADCPVVLAAEAAKALANDAMARRWAERDRMTLRLSPAYLGLAPGDLMQVDGIAGRWAIDAVTVDRLVVVAELRRTMLGGSALTADPGRGTSEPDVAIGPTDLALFDLPDLGFGGSSLGVALAASAAGAFRPVAVALTVNGQPLRFASVTRRAALGRAETVLGPGFPALIDLENAVDVALTCTAQLLLNADRDALSMGENLALLGNELIQFGRAEEIGPGRFRLSELLRGRRATEWAVGSHSAGERFLLVDPATINSVTLDPAMRGATIEAVAHGVADDPQDPPNAMVSADGEALRPPSPCQLQGKLQGDGSLLVSWVERCREGWAWVDGVADCSLDGRSFQVRVAGNGGEVELTFSASPAVVPASAVIAAGGGPLTVRVVESGPAGTSRAAEIYV